MAGFIDKFSMTEYYPRIQRALSTMRRARLTLFALGIVHVVARVHAKNFYIYTFPNLS
jgi:hypothetical protein